MSATEHHDLRTGRSLWEAKPVLRPPSSPLQHHESVDVLVVGAGISGVLVAHALSKAGLSVLIVDRRGPALGSTAASTALLQFEIDVPLTTLRNSIGATDATRCWRRSAKAVDDLRRLVSGLDTGLVNRDTLQLEGDTLDRDALAAECEARLQAGFPVQFLQPSETHAIIGAERAAILSRGNATADPLRLTLAILHRTLKSGARLAYPVKVDRAEPDADGVTARTDAGSIRASRLVFATGYELAHGVPKAGHRIISTWAIATSPQPDQVWPGQCMIWEASDPYLYLRVGPNSEIICGGEDEDLDDEDVRDRLIPTKVDAIRRKLEALIPGVDSTPVYAWAGAFGSSDTGLPTIGPVPGMPNCFAVLGFGGNGITFSMLAADIIRGAILGQPDPDAHLFSFAKPG